MTRHSVYREKCMRSCRVRMVTNLSLKSDAPRRACGQSLPAVDREGGALSHQRQPPRKARCGRRGDRKIRGGGVALKPRALEVYETAKRKGFLTAGIVSTQAKENDVKLSPCVDIVFYVRDATWGGFAPGTEQLSPTSTAMVENSDVIVAIGGGEVSRDELIAAKRLGKKVQFIPADMNHGIARERARKRGQPVPTDFRGAAGVVF
jgi:hypothetical protein